MMLIMFQFLIFIYLHEHTKAPSFSLSLSSFCTESEFALVEFVVLSVSIKVLSSFHRDPRRSRGSRCLGMNFVPKETQSSSL